MFSIKIIEEMGIKDNRKKELHERRNEIQDDEDFTKHICGSKFTEIS